jgi:hypothetical protein
MRSHSIRWWVAGVMLAGAGVASAATVTADFNTAGSIGGGAAVGSVRNSSVGTDATTDGLLGFNGFSATNFAVIGDDSGDLLSTSPSQGTSSLSFNITLSTVSDLQIGFKYKFVGWDVDLLGLVASDQFRVTLTGQPNLVNISTSVAGSSVNPFVFATTTSYSATFLGLSAGVYTLSFVLNESGSNALNTLLTNTAVAIDDVSMVSTPVPVPAAFWLLGSAVAGIVGIGRRRRQTPLA